MKRTIYLLLFNLIALSSYSQVVAIQNDRGNILYVGIQNPLTVAVENYPSASIDLTTNNGKISKIGVGHFSITPAKVGLSSIYVYRYASKETIFIDSMFFRVKRLPVQVSFMGKTSGEIAAISVYRGLTPSAYVYGLDMDAKLLIIKFTIVLKRGGQTIFTRTLEDRNGPRFDETTKIFFKTLKDGDKLSFTDIVCKDTDGSDRNLEGIDLTIIDAEGLKSIGMPRTVIDPITGVEKSY